MTHLVVVSNFNFLHSSHWITFHTQSYLVVYSLCANLLYLLLFIIHLNLVNFHISISRWSFTGVEWQRVSSSLQCSFRYSGRSEQYSYLDYLHSSFYFQLLKFFYKSFGKSYEVSRSFLSIVAQFNSAVMGVVSILAQISRSLCIFSNFFETVPEAPTSIGITVSYMYEKFPVLWQDSSSSQYLCFLLFSLFRHIKIHWMTIIYFRLWLGDPCVC